MLESKIKEIFNLSEVSQEINDKINDIEADGYTFVNISNEIMKTKNSTVGSYGFFDPSMFYEMRGQEYKIATFENETGQKRYCILNDKDELIKKSYSRLKWERTDGLSDKHIELNNAIIQELKNIGIELQEHEVFELFDLDDEDLEYLNSFPNPANHLIENILIGDIDRAIDQLQEYQINNSADRIWTQNQNGLIIAEEINCGMDRSQAAMYFISPFFRAGYNANEQNYVVDLVMEKVVPKITSLLMDKGKVLNAEQASTFGVRQKAFDILVEKIKENPQKSKDLLKEYLKYTQTSYRYPARISSVHSSVVDAIDKIIKTNPEKLNAERVNGDLQKISQRLHKSLTNYTPLSSEKINELINKVLTEYITEDPEHGKSYRETMDIISIKTRPLDINTLFEFYDNMNKYLEGKDKLPKQLLRKIVELKINNLSKQLDEILNDNSLTTKEKLMKANEAKQNFEENELSVAKMDWEERCDKADEILGKNVPECIKGLSNESFIQQYTVNINGTNISFDIPQFKELVNLQIKFNEEVRDLMIKELYEQSPYLYMKKDNYYKNEQVFMVDLPNGVSIDLVSIPECKERYDEIIAQEEGPIKAELTPHKYKVGKVDGYYSRTDYSVQIGNRTLTYGFHDWTNNGGYTAFFDDKKGFGVSSVKSEWASCQCEATEEQTNEIINLGLKYPEKFWEVFDKLSKETNCCGVYPMIYDFAERLRKEINRDWENIGCSLDVMIANRTELPSATTSDVPTQEKNQDQIK